MTIPKHAGLSQLADVANVNDGIVRYPVKKKGQPRRLDPNWPAIHWLEDSSETDTEISQEYSFGELIEGTDIYEFRGLRALGYYEAKRRDMFPWPMFQTFPVNILKVRMISYPDPCPDCDDWSRTSRCSEHHDRDGIAGLKRGGDRRRSRSSVGVTEGPLFPNTRLERDEAGDLRAVPERDMYENMIRQVANEDYCSCSRCTGAVPGRQRRVVMDNTQARSTVPTVVEVNGESVQGVAGFSFETEGDVRG